MGIIFFSVLILDGASPSSDVIVKVTADYFHTLSRYCCACFLRGSPRTRLETWRIQGTFKTQSIDSSTRWASLKLPRISSSLENSSFPSIITSGKYFLWIANCYDSTISFPAPWHRWKQQKWNQTEKQTRGCSRVKHFQSLFACQPKNWRTFCLPFFHQIFWLTLFCLLLKNFFLNPPPPLPFRKQRLKILRLETWFCRIFLFLFWAFLQLSFNEISFFFSGEKENLQKKNFLDFIQILESFSRYLCYHIQKERKFEDKKFFPISARKERKLRISGKRLCKTLFV